MGEFEQARACYLEALRIRLEIGHVRGQGATLTALAVLHQELGEPEIGLHEHNAATKSLHLIGHLLTAPGDQEAAVVAWMTGAGSLPVIHATISRTSGARLTPRR